MVTEINVTSVTGISEQVEERNSANRTPERSEQFVIGNIQRFSRSTNNPRSSNISTPNSGRSPNLLKPGQSTEEWVCNYFNFFF